MDFWSRLIGGSGSPSRPTSKGPEERLNAFKRACVRLQQIWRAGVPLSQDENAASQTAVCLERMNLILAEETRAPEPHQCLSLAVTSQIYVHATRLAISSFDSSLIRSATSFLSALIDNDEEIVAKLTFARALANLAERGAGPQLGEEEDAYLVELLFGIANKIRLQPEILPAWFTPNSLDEDKGPDEEHTVRRDDFRLFYLLMDYVHHDGRAGDFARTGLLYIIETASESRDLEKWLIESDLATLMASGLGAMYSQLTRKLTFTSFGGPTPTIIALSDSQEKQDDGHPELQVHMDAFLAYLMFWQDTFEHCKSIEVKDTLLDHFQVLFLQQLLYPSLLQSSDVDGGSTFSVLTYLSCILDAVDHPDLIRRVLEYLLATPAVSSFQRPKTPRSRMSLSRRKSFDLLAELAEADENPSLFNLVDLISLSLRSKTKNTVAAVLKLLSVILRRHHPYALTSLFKTESVKAKSKRTLAGFDESIMDFFSMANMINPSISLDESYEGYLKDASSLLESHPCSMTLLHFESFSLLEADAPPSDGEESTLNTKFMIDPKDKVFLELLALMESFFANDIMTNLSLTETFISLASCGLIHLETWLLPDCLAKSTDSGIPLDDDNINTESALSNLRTELQASEPQQTTTLLSLLQTHASQILTWRNEVPDFDSLLTLRHCQLRDSPPADPLPPRSSTQSPDPSRPAGSPTQPSFHDSPATVRTLRIQSRSSSPRGRKTRNIDSSTSSEAAGATASRSPIPRSQRVRSSWASPLRESSSAFNPASPTSDEGSPSSPTAPPFIHRNIALRVAPLSRFVLGTDTPDTDASSVGSAPGKAEEGESEGTNTVDVSLSHILTNVVVLREFVLEMAAVVQVRGGLFGEVGVD